MPRFEGAAGPSIFATGKTVRKNTQISSIYLATGAGLATGGAVGAATSYAISGYTVYDALTPLIPAAFTRIKGDYGGKEYEIYYGFGYEEHLAAKHHPATAPFIARHKHVWGRRSPFGSLQIPTFGLGWGSREVSQSRGGEHTTSSGTPITSKTIDGPSAKPVTPIGGTSSITPRAPRRGGGGKTAGGTQKARGRRAPYCWVHKKRHFCKLIK